MILCDGVFSPFAVGKERRASPVRGKTTPPMTFRRVASATIFLVSSRIRGKRREPFAEAFSRTNTAG